jgi:hypothetical protein
MSIVLQGQDRGDDGKVTMALFKRTVNVLYTLSTSGLLGEGICSVRRYPLMHWYT